MIVVGCCAMATLKLVRRRGCGEKRVVHRWSEMREMGCNIIVSFYVVCLQGTQVMTGRLSLTPANARHIMAPAQLWVVSEASPHPI